MKFIGKWTELKNNHLDLCNLDLERQTLYDVSLMWVLAFKLYICVFHLEYT